MLQPPCALDEDLFREWEVISEEAMTEIVRLSKTSEPWSDKLEDCVKRHLTLTEKQFWRDTRKAIYWTVGITVLFAGLIFTATRLFH